MIDEERFAALLWQATALEISRVSGVDPKTIHRLPHRKHSPKLSTVIKLMAAMEKINAERQAVEAIT
jgi:predicted transcriptional regulator